MKAFRTVAAVALIGLTTLTAAHAQSGRYQDRFDRQDEKNASRTVGIGLGALALDRLSKGRVGDALLLGVGAAAAGKHFEDIRKEQDCDRDDRRGDRYDDRRGDRYDDRRGDRYRYERERLERERIERERARREWERRERQERLERERREQERREWERRHDRWHDRNDNRRDDRRDRDDEDCRDHREYRHDR